MAKECSLLSFKKYRTDKTLPKRICYCEMRLIALRS